MTSPQEQLTELTRRTQENFKHLWEQWSQRSSELLKGVGGRSHPAAAAPGNAEDVLDAVFDFAENLIAQQRAFAKQMLRAANTAQQATADTATTDRGPHRANRRAQYSGRTEPDDDRRVGDEPHRLINARAQIQPQDPHDEQGRATRNVPAASRGRSGRRGGRGPRHEEGPKTCRELASAGP